MNKDFLLEQDLVENRQNKFYYNNQLVLQSNGTNPRIRRIGSEEKLQYAAITETSPDYEVRIILSEGMQFLLNANYELELNGVKRKYKCVDIIPSYEDNLYVKIILVKSLD